MEWWGSAHSLHICNPDEHTALHVILTATANTPVGAVVVRAEREEEAAFRSVRLLEPPIVK